MKLNDIFKAIRLRVKTSKPYQKDFYGEECREFVFEDSSGNDVGLFVLHPEGDVCQIIIEAVIQNSKHDHHQEALTCRWINPLLRKYREDVLSKKSHLEQIREYFIHNNISYESIEDSSRILDIVSCVCDGQAYILNNENEKEDLLAIEANNEIFFKLAKAAYKSNISVNELLEKFLSENESDKKTNLSGNNVGLVNGVNMGSDMSNKVTLNNSSLNKSNLNNSNMSGVNISPQFAQTSFIQGEKARDVKSFVQDEHKASVSSMTGSSVKKVKDSRILAYQNKNIDNDEKDTTVGVSVDLSINNYGTLSSSVETDLSLGVNNSSSVQSISSINSGNVKLDSNESLLNVEDSYRVKFPDCLNGSFEIGKGFIPKLRVMNKLDEHSSDVTLENHQEIKDVSNMSRVAERLDGSAIKSPVVKKGELVPMVEPEVKRSLKDRVLPGRSPINLSDGVKNHIHRYPGDKTVLSNLKTI